MALTINLTTDINNTSLQIGDTAYYIDGTTTTINDITSTSSSPEKIGKITGKTTDSIIIDTPSVTPPPGAFIMFQKDRTVNNNSLLGYFAEVKLINNSTEKAELFALSSEISPSSK